MTNKKLMVLLPVLGVFAVIAFGAVASAQTMPPQGGQGGPMMGHSGFRGGPGPVVIGGMYGPGGPGQGVRGTVTAVSGTTINVQSVMRVSTSTMATTTVDYSVNASDATVLKDNATSTVSAINVGDMVAVRGTVSGTSVVATNIIDGVMPGRGGFPGGPFNGSSTRQFRSASGTMPFASSTPSITGTVAAVSGTTLTVNGSNGTTYTVDITNAALIKQGNATNSISAINVGDNVQIQGTISGTSVTAKVVLDNVSTNSNSSSHPGFFGAIQSFFSNIFHFRF